MKNKFEKLIPDQKSIENSKELKGLKSFFKSSTLWTFDRESVARGVAAGLAGAVIPGFQLFYAALLVILFRGNLPIALAATFVTNPVTSIPVIFLICSIGAWFCGDNTCSCIFQHFHWDFSSFHAFWANFSVWILQFGKAFLIGVPIVSFILAIGGYCFTILIWKIFDFFNLYKK